MEIKTESCSLGRRRELFCRSFEQAIDTEAELPETLPEAARLLKCSLKPVLIGKTLSGKSLTVDGEARISCIYADGDGCINSHEHTVTFKKTVELSEEADELRVSLKAAHLNYRPSGPRRIDIHGAVSISVTALENESVELLGSAEGMGLETKSETIDCSVLEAKLEKSIIIEEELTVSSEKSGIGRIITSSLTAECEECRRIADKLMLKGLLMLHMTYIPEDSRRCRCFEARVPFSQLLELGSTEEDGCCITEVRVASYELSAKRSSDGSAVILLEAKLAARAELYIQRLADIIVDAYSTEYEAEATSGTAYCERLIKQINESYICKKCLEFSTGSLESIVDIKSEITSSSVTGTENGIAVGGTVTVAVLGFDSEGLPAFFERALDFSYSFPLENAEEGIRTDTDIKILGTGFTLQESDRVEIRAEMSVKCTVFAQKSVRAIERLSVSEDRKKAPPQFSVAICYGTEGEELWSLAKRYGTSVSEIMRANGMEDEDDRADGVLLIPCL